MAAWLYSCLGGAERAGMRCCIAVLGALGDKEQVHEIGQAQRIMAWPEPAHRSSPALPRRAKTRLLCPAVCQPTGRGFSCLDSHIAGA